MWQGGRVSIESWGLHLEGYSANSVPPEIAEDIASDIQTCECGYVLRLAYSSPIGRVARIVEDGSKEWD